MDLTTVWSRALDVGHCPDCVSVDSPWRSRWGRSDGHRPVPSDVRNTPFEVDRRRIRGSSHPPRLPVLEPPRHRTEPTVTGRGSLGNPALPRKFRWGMTPRSAEDARAACSGSASLRFGPQSPEVPGEFVMTTAEAFRRSRAIQTTNDRNMLVALSIQRSNTKCIYLVIVTSTVRSCGGPAGFGRPYRW